MCANLYTSARSCVIRPRVLQEPVELGRHGRIQLDELKDGRLSCNEGTRKRDDEVVSCCKEIRFLSHTSNCTQLTRSGSTYSMLSFLHLQCVKSSERKT